jgi:hypothetical protein
MTDDKFQMTDSPASARPTARQAAKERKDRKKGPRMDTNTREDKPQMNQPSSGRRRTMAGKLLIYADKKR